MNLIVDCSRVVAEANVYCQHNAGILRHPFRGHGAMSQYYQPILPEWALLFGVCKGALVVKKLRHVCHAWACECLLGPCAASGEDVELDSIDVGDGPGVRQAVHANLQS